MKSNRGVTTTSLIIYVIAMTIVIGIIATINSFFYSNVMNLEDGSSNISELTKFNMYFLEDTKKTNNDIVKLSNNSITFSSGNTFTFQDNAIYLNNIRICEDVQNLQFSVNENSDKNIINVLVTIGDNMEYTRTTKYVMKK
mgnify:FL=1